MNVDVTAIDGEDGHQIILTVAHVTDALYYVYLWEWSRWMTLLILLMKADNLLIEARCIISRSDDVTVGSSRWVSRD